MPFGYVGLFGDLFYTRNTFYVHGDLNQTKGGDVLRALNTGFGSSVMIDRIITIMNPESQPVKRIIKDAKDNGLCIDLTYGRKARAAIMCDNHMVILSSIQAETLKNRINDLKDGRDDAA